METTLTGEGEDQGAEPSTFPSRGKERVLVTIANLSDTDSRGAGLALTWHWAEAASVEGQVT